MCGITGIYSAHTTLATRQRVEAMNTALAHRGPDDAGIFEGDHVVLGHRRLSIIDLSPGGHQPMHSADGRYTIVFNGEIYNFREVRAQITNWQFRSESDTEVILAAYAQWGKACVQHFNGMFAFALYDAHTRELWIVRDRLGIKPLYYWYHEGTLVFASEIRAVLASELVVRRASETAVGEYLRWQTVLAPNTIVENVHLLPAGHWMLLSSSGMKQEAWWTLPGNFRKEVAAQPLPEIHKEIRRLLREAVERRLVADVPFGAFLSGGIDSSAIVALMSEVSSAPVNTFSVTFDESEFSEAKYAKMVADKYGTRHHEIRLRPDDFLHDLPAAVAAMDHPGGDGPNTWVVSKATKAAGITMALTGLGGDELFAGYSVFTRMAELEGKAWLNQIPRPLRSMGGRMLELLRPGVASSKTAEVLRLPKINFESAYPLSRLLLLPGQLKQIGGNAFPVNDVFKAHTQLLKEFAGNDYLLSRISIAEMSTYMQHVLLRDSDQMSMAHGLELRVPFMDYTLVEYALSIPDNYKYPHTPKKLLVDALGDLLPREIIDRPKMGFTLPWEQWMKNELSSFCETNLFELTDDQYDWGFSQKGLKKIWRQFKDGDPNVSWSRIWPLVVLGHWLKKNNVSL
ncbi:MAG: asparagine synthase (glutamine-hydrolyzing) [Bacteroidetes bacterium]|nr:asparagine synthase (glutamine-hydrolyzing) [Bacteroidota bacterium]